MKRFFKFVLKVVIAVIVVLLVLYLIYLLPAFIVGFRQGIS